MSLPLSAVRDAVDRYPLIDGGLRPAGLFSDRRYRLTTLVKGREAPVVGLRPRLAIVLGSTGHPELQSEAIARAEGYTKWGEGFACPWVPYPIVLAVKTLHAGAAPGFGESLRES